MAYTVIPFGQARSGDQGSISNHSARQDILSPYPYLPLSDPEHRIRILHLDAAEQHAAPLCGHFEEEFITRPEPADFDDPSSHKYKTHDKWCNQCGIRIRGARHKCAVCDDLDYCFTCIASASETHSNHDFELIEVLQTYEALSYSWGGAFDDEDLADGTIVISGHTVPIRGNLFNALRRLRYPDRPRRLWIDALCINQDDIPERNGQVQSMETIYSHCSKVLVWLGEDTEILDGGLIFSLATILDQLQAIEPSAGSTEPTTEELSAEIETLKAEYSALYSAGQIRVREQLNEAINSNAEVNALCCETFLARRYFSRRWVVQEVYWARASDRPAEVLCGSLQSNRDSIAATMRLIGHLVGGIADEEHMLLSLPLLLSRPTPQPMEVLKLFNHFGCSEPRDRIFALVSLCSGQTVDYNRSCEEVYTEFAAEVAMDETLYKWEQLLWLAAYQASSPLRKPETELPSWVPDWRLELPGGWSMMAVDRDIEGYLHSAGVTWKPPVCLNMNVFGQMEIRGSNKTTRQIRLLLDSGPQHSSSKPYRVVPYNSGNDTLVAGELQSGDLLCGPLCQQKDAARGRSAIVLRPGGFSEEFIAQIPYERDGGDFRRDKFSGMQPVCKVVGLYGIDLFGEPCPTPYQRWMVIR